MPKARQLMLGGAIGIGLAISIASAQSPPAARVRGTIESVDGTTLNVKSTSGDTVKVKLADKAPIRTVIKQSLTDIKPNSFVGITTMPQPDGSEKALEIHIFPEALRGTGEGQQPWDLAPNTKMTNGTIDSSVESVNGHTLVVKYKGSEQKVVVTPTTAIVTYAPATVADLKPGEKVFVARANKLADGTLEAPNITVGRDGVEPPM